MFLVYGFGTAAELLGKKVEVLETRKIKKYSPGVLHVVVDARISE